MSVTHLGNTSFTTQYRITSEVHQGQLAAQSKAVLVLIDYHTGQTVVLDERVRSKIMTLENNHE